MATITAAANGNWSDGATWTGGVVPGDGDTADLNGKTVTWNLLTIPASGTLASLTSSGSSGKLNLTASGSNTYTLNVADTASSIQAGTDTMITVTGAAPSASVVINGNPTGGSTTARYAIEHNSSATLTLNGKPSAGSGSVSPGLVKSGTGNVTVTSASTIAAGLSNNYAINNNSTGGTLTVNANTGSLAIVNSVAGTVILNGNVLGGGAANPSLRNASTGSITVNGNVQGAASGTSANGITNASAGTITVNGNVTGGGDSGANGITHTGNGGSIVINGNVTSGTHHAAYGVQLTNPNALCTVNGSIIYSGTGAPLVGPHRINSAAGRYTQWVQTDLSTIRQYREDAVTDPADVRSGTTFWTNGASDTGELGGGTVTITIP